MLENAQLRAAIAVSLGAIAGALCRHYLSQEFIHVFGVTFPWGTFGVNLSGCFLMGLLITLAANRWPFQPEILLILTTGFLGSYTTFSSYELETSVLVDRRGLFSDVAYWLGSPLLGLASLTMGISAAKVLWSRNQGDRQ
ncbi:MAG: fluoride efflux transporter CrcB [Leptolyngbya sp. SIOISBB]|nr:fluoride efflux transporter CrcB [Leptolyngbya sp. SIOISBB]